MKAFVRHSRTLGGGLGDALTGLDANVRVALAHYGGDVPAVRPVPVCISSPTNQNRPDLY